MKSLDQYVEVHVRIAQFWEKFPRGRIETEIVYPDENTVRCRASIYRENSWDPGNGTPILDVGGLPPFVTGHAEEKRDVGMVNKTSATENCETSAVGRALALAGFSIHKGIASREEVEIAQRKAQAQADAPKPVKSPEKTPERFAEYLRLAIQAYDAKELSDERIWESMLASASDKQSNTLLVKSLNAKLAELGGDPEAVLATWQARQEKTT